MVRKKTRKRLEGIEQVVGVAARQISPVDKVYDAKDGFEGVYKVWKGRNLLWKHNPENRR